jgi:putative ABC transport system permease protein
VVINETAAQLYGFDRPTENTLRTVGPQGETFDVIGVVEDFHFQSLRQPIRPVILTLDAAPRKVLVRAKPGQSDTAIAGIEQTWATFAPGLPLTYGFADAQYAQLHEDTQRTGRLFLVFAGLAIAVACFGLFGLAMYTAQRRTKEIGIRKALGATTSQIIFLLSNRFAQLVGVAFVMAAPIAYLGMTHWLSDFAYHVDPSVGAFLSAGAVAMAVALGTVSIHAFRAARLDPATTLQDE